MQFRGKVKLYFELPNFACRVLHALYLYLSPLTITSFISKYILSYMNIEIWWKFFLKLNLTFYSTLNIQGIQRDSIYGSSEFSINGELATIRSDFQSKTDGLSLPQSRTVFIGSLGSEVTGAVKCTWDTGKLSSCHRLEDGKRANG